MSENPISAAAACAWNYVYALRDTVQKKEESLKKERASLRKSKTQLADAEKEAIALSVKS